jgi:hypothetical protein
MAYCSALLGKTTTLWWILAVGLSQGLPILHYHGAALKLHWAGEEYNIQKLNALTDLTTRVGKPVFDKGLLLFNMDWTDATPPKIASHIQGISPRCVVIAVSSPRVDRYKRLYTQKEFVKLVMNPPSKVEFRKM